MQPNKIVSREEWTAARRALLAKEKAFTKKRDALSALRRDLPWVRVDKDYMFEGSDGPESLSDLFEGRSQLIVYHFMFGPDWEEGCKSCSFMMDHTTPALVHIRDRGVAFAVVSRAPLAKLRPFQERMGWDLHWVSSNANDFNEDFGVSVSEARAEAGSYQYNYEPDSSPAGTELPGLSVFVKDDEGRLLHTYSTYARGLDAFLGAYRFLDIVPGGRNEEGLSYPMEWIRHHDRYEDDPPSNEERCH